MPPLTDPKYTKEPLRVVVPWDPAIDFAKSDLDRYCRTRDLDCLKFRPGSNPTVYYVKQLSNGFFGRLMQNAKDDITKLIACFQFHVCKIQDLVRPDGTVAANWEPTQLIDERAAQLGACIGDDEIELFDLPTILDIGSVAYQRGFFPRNLPPSYQAPLTSLEATDVAKTLSATADASK